MKLWTYSPEEVTIMIGGVYKIIGVKEGSFITIDRDIQPFTSTRHTDGSITRLHIKDVTYTVTLTLMSGSPSNEILGKIQIVDSITQMAKFPFLIKDKLGTSMFFSATSWVEEVPSLEFSNVVTDRVWKFKCASCSINYGGNDRISGNTEDVVSGIIGALPEVLESVLG